MINKYVDTSKVYHITKVSLFSLYTLSSTIRQITNLLIIGFLLLNTIYFTCKIISIIVL